jgi:polyribonucleotide nucleotidyltransferase
MADTFECSIGGRVLKLKTGELARQANGAVLVQYGDTVVLTTVCASQDTTDKLDFVPLTVDYEEKLYAAGKIPGSFLRREGRPGTDAILTCRFIDRGLRPLLSKRFNRETQVIATVLSADMENSPDVCAVIGASAALSISNIPFAGPISVVHVGYIDGDYFLNPTLPQIEKCLLDIAVVSTAQDMVMVEANAKEVSEDVILKAIRFGHKANQEIIELQKKLQQAYGKPKIIIESREMTPELSNRVHALLDNKLEEALSQPDKANRARALNVLQDELLQDLADSFPEKEIRMAYEALFKDEVRKWILLRKQHIDGRPANEIRHIYCQVGLLPRTHGSALFARGETQVLTITTLGSSRQEQLLDGLGLEDTKHFMHHYNFPPFSTGEVKRTGSPGRREIGHGALGERAISPILPTEEDFPYTIRLVSEVLGSNGSTSMASICGSTLSLMDAGVPIKTPVAGIAMGLVTGQGGEYVILTDIEGLEDANGDMDFKVAGTRQGITALQLDIKLKGMDLDILTEALNQALQARLEILDKMAQVISTSRLELSPYAPKMQKITIDSSKIGIVIGPGGKTIRAITEETGSSIDVKNDGSITIGSPNGEAAQKAIKMIEDLTREVKVGDTYSGKVTRILNFGAMVEILPGREGLVHVSELADHYVSKVEDVVKEGDEIAVKVIEIDNMGRVNLSHRAILQGASYVDSTEEESLSDSRRNSQKRPSFRQSRSPNRYSGHNNNTK